jgi:hypothetical protein
MSDAESETPESANGESPELPSEEELEAEAGDEPETIVTIGDEKPAEPERAPAWVKEVRRQNRELQRKVRELEAQAQVRSAESLPADPGPEPTLESTDYDAEAFSARLKQWYQRKAERDRHAEKQKHQAEAEQRAWQDQLRAYGKAKEKLGVHDYDEAESVTESLLSTQQQGVILHGAQNPALVIYALGRNPTKAKELARETDLVRFAFGVSKLESQLKVTKRKTAPPPEKPVKATSGHRGAGDGQLERLREEAAKTGDYSKVFAHQRRRAAQSS